MSGVLKWGDREKVDEKQSAYYDHTFYRVPVVGSVNIQAIRQALSAKWLTSLTGSSVGGYVTCGSVEDNYDGTVTVEVVYHIGD